MLRLVRSEELVSDAHADIHKAAEAARIDVQEEVVVSDSFLEALHRQSKDAALVLVGFQPPPEGDGVAFLEQFGELLEGMPTTLLVNSSGDADVFA